MTVQTTQNPTSAGAPLTLVPVKPAPKKKDTPPEGALVTFETIKDGEVLDALNEAIQQADRHLEAAGGKGKARITLKLEIQASGPIRVFVAKQKLDLPEVTKADSKVKAVSRDGTLRFIDEEAQKQIDAENREQAKANAQTNAAKGKAIADKMLGSKSTPPAPGSTVTATIEPGKAATPKAGDQTMAAGVVSVGVADPLEAKRLRDAGITEAPKASAKKVAVDG